MQVNIFIEKEGHTITVIISLIYFSIFKVTFAAGVLTGRGEGQLL